MPNSPPHAMGGFVFAPYAIAIIGVGKIARDQHLPVIAKNPRFRLAGVVSHSGAQVAGVPTFVAAGEALRRAARSRRCGHLHAADRAPRPGARGARRGQACDAGKAAGADDGGNARSDRLRRRARPRHFRHLAFAVQRRRRRSESAARGRETSPPRDRMEGGREALASGPGMDLGRRQFRRLRSRRQRAVDPDQDRAGRRSSSKAPN